MAPVESKKRYRLLVEYDGTNFSGWQRQLDRPSVQQSIEDAIQEAFQEKVVVEGAGRTDSGVHALGQVAHFDLSKNLAEMRIQDGLNHFLKRQGASILKVQQVPIEFHARFSAKSRSYRYLIINRRSPLAIQSNRAHHIIQTLDITKMQKAAAYFIGTHDFTSFRDSNCQAESPVRTLDLFHLNSIGDLVCAEVKSKSFLHHQVRIMIGTLCLVGVGRLAPEQIPEILEEKDRSYAGPTAPAYGLYLTSVEY